jgi:hypothetical protein
MPARLCASLHNPRKPKPLLSTQAPTIARAPERVRLKLSDRRAFARSSADRERSVLSVSGRIICLLAYRREVEYGL